MFHNPMKMHYCFALPITACLPRFVLTAMMTDSQRQKSGIKLLAFYSKGNQDSVQRTKGDF